jgi:coenzyme F420-reducing hydrogenase delta subunit
MVGPFWPTASSGGQQPCVAMTASAWDAAGARNLDGTRQAGTYPLVRILAINCLGVTTVDDVFAQFSEQGQSTGS